MNSHVYGDPNDPVKVAVVQAEPCWFDIEAATVKTCELITEAGAKGAKLVAFPELWIPGYPNFIHAKAAKETMNYNLKYYRNSIDVRSHHMERILQTPIGRIGGLQCFEHLQPLLKYNTYFQGEQIHVASWPNLFPPVGKMPFFNTVESCMMATHTLAVEGATFVLLASSTQTEKGLVANGLVDESEHAGQGEKPHTAVVGGGFSEIIAPDGRALVKAPSPTFEGLLYAELEFDEIYIAKSIVDTVGRYSRPDLFTLQVRSKLRRQCEYDETSDIGHVSRFPDLPIA
ncbi:Arylacetonitrilase [Colletotrichum aenigma]|uniref:Arylacetonitrilase n=1 Tax=Colletotrichum aenigma TaxID=1215731 RepID=UPI0018722E92|nr:Arylacetonitrilase [Colletotrichum aenigma]KAF5520008.1 Arylacetonitrilase [Colletotrichum aenigma]